MCVCVCVCVCVCHFYTDNQKGSYHFYSVLQQKQHKSNIMFAYQQPELVKK